MHQIGGRSGSCAESKMIRRDLICLLIACHFFYAPPRNALNATQIQWGKPEPPWLTVRQGSRLLHSLLQPSPNGSCRQEPRAFSLPAYLRNLKAQVRSPWTGWTPQL